MLNAIIIMDNKKKNNILKTINLHMPLKKDGTKDERYTLPQFCKSNGTKDKRTKNTHKIR